MPKASFSITASPLGEEEPGLKGAERGGYLPIPRRDARAGEWDFWRRIRGAELAAAARATEGSESLSVNLIRVNSDEHDAKHDARSGMEKLPARSGTTKPGASSGIDLEEKQGHVASEAKRKEHGAPSPEYD